MAIPLLERWRGGEFTLGVHRAGNSIAGLSRIQELRGSVPLQPKFSLAVEGDLKWCDEGKNTIFYFYHGGGFGEEVLNRAEVGRLQKEGKVLLLEDAFDLSESLLYNFDLRRRAGSKEALEKAFSICDKNGRLNDIWVSAFDLNTLRQVKEVCPEVPTMFLSFFSPSYSTYLHQPSFKMPRSWGFVSVGDLGDVDIVTTWPRGYLSPRDCTNFPFGAVMGTQKVWDTAFHPRDYSSRRRIIGEALALEEHNKFSFPGDFTSLKGARKYYELVENTGLRVAGVYCADIPESLEAFWEKRN